MAVVEVIGTLLSLALGVVGGAIALYLLASPNDDQQRLRHRSQEAEQEIGDIGRWEQQALMAELLRRTRERGPDDRLSPPPVVIDGNVLHVEDEPGGPR